MALDLLSSAEIARLAGVRRPVVSVWRARHRHGPHPFPPPRSHHAGTHRFDRAEVTAWLEATGRSPVDEPADLPRLLDFDPRSLGATPGHEQPTATAVFVALTLASQTTGSLAELSVDETLDLVEDLDPDGRDITEAMVRQPGWGRCAAYAESLADACYSHEAAVEWLLDHPEAAPPGWSRHRFDPRLTRLVAELAHGLAAEVDTDPPRYAEVGRGGSDLARALWSGPERDSQPVYLLDGAATPAARLGRLRGEVAGQRLRDLGFAGLTPSLPRTPVVAVAGFPTPDEPDLTDLDILRRIAAIERALPLDGRAVLVGPASALCDVPREAAAARAQDALLRDSRLRAAIRLPVGLMLARPHQRLGLWVLGRIAEQERRRHDTIAVGCLDLAAVTDEIDALVDDLHAAGDATALAPRRLAVLRHRSLPEILSGAAALTPRRPTVRRQWRDDPNEITDSVEVHRRVAVLARGVPGLRLHRVADGEQTPMRRATIRDLLAQGQLRVMSGVSAEVAHDPAGDVPVLTAAALGAGRPAPQRTSRSAVLAAELTHRLSQPGDVAFVTRPSPYAVVDRAGGSLVLAPARCLRVTRRAEGLLPDAVAQAIRDIGAGASEPSDAREVGWRDWVVPLLPAHELGRAAALLDLLDGVERHARDVTDAVTALRRDVVRGAAYESIEPTDPTREESTPHAT